VVRCGSGSEGCPVRRLSITVIDMAASRSRSSSTVCRRNTRRRSISRSRGGLRARPAVTLHRDEQAFTDFGKIRQDYIQTRS
jgi:hypothetical protein